MLELYATSKAFQERPSQRLRLREQLEREGAFDPDLLCDGFDTAVLTAGNLYEAHAHQHDEKRDGNFRDYMKRFMDGAPETTEQGTLKKLVQLFGAPLPAKPKTDS